MTQLFWIEGPWHGRLAISARPPGGDWLADEMIDWRHAGVDTVVSLLAAEEIQDLELIREEPLCRAAGMEFVSFPIVDRGVPDSFRALPDCWLNWARNWSVVRTWSFIAGKESAVPG